MAALAAAHFKYHQASIYIYIYIIYIYLYSERETVYIYIYIIIYILMCMLGRQWTKEITDHTTSSCPQSVHTLSELTVSTIDAMVVDAYLSPSNKENSGDANGVPDVLSCSRKKFCLGSLGDRIRAARLEPTSPEALPCSSEILPPQHLWTPHFTSPTSDAEARRWQPAIWMWMIQIKNHWKCF